MLRGGYAVRAPCRAGDRMRNVQLNYFISVITGDAETNRVITAVTRFNRRALDKIIFIAETFGTVQRGFAAGD